MNTKHILLLAALLSAASVAIAQGPPEQNNRAGRPDCPMAGKPGAGHPMAGLDLTDSQKAKMDDLRVKHLKEVEPLKADLQKQHSALKLEVIADKFNESKVKSLQSEISKLQSDMALKMILHQRAVRDLLTSDQQKKFDTRVLSGGGPGAGMHPGMNRSPGMGKKMGMGQGMNMHRGTGMDSKAGMHRGMMKQCENCPCKDEDKADEKPEPKK